MNQEGVAVPLTQYVEELFLMKGQDEDNRAKRFFSRYHRFLQKLEARKDALLERIRQDVRLCREDQLTETAQEFRSVIKTIKFLRQLCPGGTPKEKAFVFSSLLLEDSFKLCCEVREKEGMHFIVGIEHDGLLLGTRIVPFTYSHRSIAGAGGDHGATHKISIELHEANHAIVALMHSHPGNGLNANHNSGTDLQTQKRWEQGWPLISGIWSRDGYVRFFSWQLPFSVQVVGNHIEEVEGENHVFQLKSRQTFLAL